jgi:hypothetical protein
MTRFNNTDEVREAAEKAAADDYQRHLPVHTDENGKKWQVDLNPYCTPGARNCWQRGFDGAPPHSWERDLRWDFQYQRGAAAARIVKAGGLPA